VYLKNKKNSYYYANTQAHKTSNYCAFKPLFATLREKGRAYEEEIINNGDPFCHFF
jgi:hypothetical protein